MSEIDKLLKDDVRLPSPPAIAIRILEAVKKDESDYNELAKIISSDPSLAAKTLKAANSSLYGLTQRVSSLSKALAVLGLSAAKNIALSFVIAKELRSPSETEFNFEFFWKRSVTAAVASDLCASLIGKKNDEAFVSGLLQDTGIVIMYLCREEDYLKVLDEKYINKTPIDIAERKVFGFDHQEVGSEILRQWGLPESIYLPIRYHHKRVDFQNEYTHAIDSLYASDRISSIYHGAHGSDKDEQLRALLGDNYQKNKEEMDGLIDSVAEKSNEMLSLFEIDADKMKPYSVILEETNEELAKLNLSYGQLLMKYKEEMVRAENLARKLKAANQELKVIAVRDNLTGLYNNRFFNRQLNIELSRSVRYRKPFSLVMMDLDHFKKVNDAYGHRTGDIVLQKISALIQKRVRISDIICRYGGEEFAVILPETDLKAAAHLAERLRTSIEQEEIKVDANRIKITASIGVSTYLPAEGRSPSKSDLLEAADSALYASKRDGRNKLSMAKLS